MNCENPVMVRRVRLGIPVLETVPCGKCAICLRNTQNGYVIRTVEEQKKRGSMYFITLTYASNSVPVAFDKDGEIADESLIPIMRKPKQFRKRYKPDDDYRLNRDIECNYDFDNQVELCDISEIEPIVDDFTMEDLVDEDGCLPRNINSLRSKDVVDWKKRCKRSIEYHEGKRLDFGYMICGEYGPRTLRPHYHGLFFGLTDSQMDVFVKDWEKNFGFVCLKKIAYTDVVKVAKYVGKYIVKGLRNENPNAVKGYCEKPRKIVSVGYGEMTAKRREEFFRDVAGVDGIMLCEHPDDLANVSLPTLEKVVDKMSDGIHYKMSDGYVYRLPPYLRKKLFYIKERVAVEFVEKSRTEKYADNVWSPFVNCDDVFGEDDIESKINKDVKIIEGYETTKFVWKYRPSALYNLVMFALQRKVGRAFIDKCEELASYYADGKTFENMDAITERLYNIEKGTIESRAKAIEKDNKSVYSKSRF